MNKWHSRNEYVWRVLVIPVRGYIRCRTFQTQEAATTFAEELDKYPGGIKSVMLERVEQRVLSSTTIRGERQ